MTIDNTTMGNTPTTPTVPDLSGMNMTEMIIAQQKAIADAESTPEPEQETTDVNETEQPPQELSPVESEETENQESEDEPQEQPEEEVTDDDDDTETSDEDVYEIMGKEYTEAELVELTRAGLRNDDYTRKTQELAEQRKALETERQDLSVQFQKEVKEQQDAYLNAIDELHKIKQVMLPPVKTKDELAAMAVEDPKKYNQYIAVSNAIENGLKDVKSIFEYDDQVSQQQQQKYILQQEDILKKDDEWKDLPTVYPKFIENLVANNIPEQTGRGILDAEVIKLLNDGIKYRNGRTTAEKNVKEKRDGVRIIKKATNKPKPVQTRKSNVAEAVTSSQPKTTKDLINMIGQITRN